jgi:hypothetical protein
MHYEFIPESAMVKKERHKRWVHFSAGGSLLEVFQNVGSIDWVLLHITWVAAFVASYHIADYCGTSWSTLSQPCTSWFSPLWGRSSCVVLSRNCSNCTNAGRSV